MASGFVVPVTIATIVGMSEADTVIKGHPPTVKPVIGGFILGIFLYAIMELDTRLGSLFAGLIVLNSIVQHGSTVFGRLAK